MAGLDWTSIIATVMGAISTIVCGWFVYNQHTKNARTDHEIEKIKTEDKIRNKRRSDNSMVIYGVLWELLYATKADRVYIVQGHPLGNEEFLTIYFEVKRRWAEPMKPHIQKMKMSDVGKFASTIAKNTMMYITDIDAEVEDRYAQSIFSACGTEAVIVKKLSDNRHDWVGSIFCEFTDKLEIGEEEAKDLLHKAATDIQYILPEIRD